MSNAAQSWAWKQNCGYSSDKNVLVALADNAWEDGSHAWPSVKLLTEKTGLGERTVRLSLKRLVVNGFIEVQAEAQPRAFKPTTYRVRLERDPETPLVSERKVRPPRAKAAPGELAAPPAAAAPGVTTAAHPLQQLQPPPAAAAPEPLKNQLPEPKELPATSGAAKRSTDGQRINAIVNAYVEAEPLSNYPAVRGIVAKAFKTHEFSDDEISAALLRLAADGRSVTTDTLRIELRGYPGPRRDPTGMNRTNQRNLAVVEQFARGEIA